jgi:hypothetical protein
VEPAFEKKEARVLSIDAEYRKYVTSQLSSENTDILRFWEVSLYDLTRLGL